MAYITVPSGTTGSARRTSSITACSGVYCTVPVGRDLHILGPSRSKHYIVQDGADRGLEKFVSQYEDYNKAC